MNTLLEEAVVGAVEQSRGEELVATIKSVIIKLEASVGRRTVPMLTVDASVEAVVKDWSTKVCTYSLDIHFTLTEYTCTRYIHYNLSPNSLFTPCFFLRAFSIFFSIHVFPFHCFCYT